VMDTSRPREERLAAFYRRSVWTRWLGHPHSALGQINQMITSFADLGVVEQRPGLPGDPDFPPVMYVESTPRAQLAATEAAASGEPPHDQGLTMPASLRLNRGRPHNR